MDTILNFKSPSEFLEFIDYGSMSEVLSTARSGCPEGMSLVQDLLQSLILYVEPEKFRKEFIPSTSGLFFDIGMVCAKLPECWLDLQESFNNGSFLTNDPNEEKENIKLGLNVTIPFGLSKKTAMERGAALTVLAYLLEQSGRAVTITQYCAMQKNHHNFSGEVILKSANQPLDTDILTFWLVNPNSFRRCWMRVIESLPHSSSLGVQNGRMGIPDILHGKELTDVFIPGVINKKESWTREDSVAWICKELQKLKINFIT